MRAALMLVFWKRVNEREQGEEEEEFALQLYALLKCGILNIKIRVRKKLSFVMDCL